MNWGNFSTNLRLKITKKFSINLSGAFDPYIYALNEAGNPVRVNTLRWNVGKFPRFLGTGTSFSYSFNNDTFKKLKEKLFRKGFSSDEINEYIKNLKVATNFATLFLYSSISAIA